MDWLITEDIDGIRWLTLDRPERKNAVPMDGWPELTGAFRDFEASSSRILVVTGSGSDFCAGADLDPSRIDTIQTVTDRHRRMKIVGEAAMTLHRLSKPTIAAVDGVAVGAGMNLALGCDVVVATSRARFSEIFVKRGLTVDFGGSWLLPRIVGMQRAKELALSGRIVDAEEALRMGLVTVVVAPDQLRSAATEMAESFVAGAPKAQMFAKQALNASFEMSLADALSWEGQSQSILLGTEDAAEGILSFIEKRDPDWKGR
ncbi:MAG: enoyl-CoA hydratase/isomerase family protein [Acidimicrobiia bacterium]|nr:enoyl-CoA hydratase/isomerase family protein [Acidimicrobiia bacterium]